MARRSLLTALLLLTAAEGACSQSAEPVATEEPGEPTPAQAECATPQPGWIWCDDFEVDRLGSYFEAPDADGSFVRTENVGVDGSSAMRVRWDAGQVGAGALHLAVGRSPDGPDGYRRSVGPPDRDFRALYWRLYLRNQEGWVGDGADKLSRATVFYTPDHWGQAMTAHVWSGGPENRHLILDPSSGTDEAGTVLAQGYNDPHRWLGQARSETPIFAADRVGAWYCVEAYVRLNEPGASNGELRLWIDERLEAERAGLNWVGSYSGYGLNAVFVENYWNDGSPVAQERYLDNFVVSTERIGCLG